MCNIFVLLTNPIKNKPMKSVIIFPSKVYVTNTSSTFIGYFLSNIYITTLSFKIDKHLYFYLFWIAEIKRMIKLWCCY